MIMRFEGLSEAVHVHVRVHEKKRIIEYVNGYVYGKAVSWSGECPEWRYLTAGI